MDAAATEERPKHHPLKESFMKTGILTFHAGPNYGAYFQALALQSFLTSRGHEACIIDYKHPTLVKAELASLFPMRPLPRIPALIWRFWINNWIKHRRFAKAHRAYKLLPFYTIEHSNLAAVVVGSDEVWNLQNPLFGFDPQLLAPFWKGRKIGYAICAGTTTPDAPIPVEAVKMISDFDHIAARDRNTADFVARHTHRKPEIVLDPTFLVSFALQQAVKIPRVLKERKYLAVYGYSFSEETTAATLNFARKHGLITVALGYRNRWCDINYTSAGPWEFLEAMRGASAVVTMMFHGSLFSTHLHRPFAVELTPYRINKFSQLISWKPFSRRVISGERTALDILQEPVDWGALDDDIERDRKRSVEYLNRALS